MRSMFSGHFRPTDEEFKELWKNAIFCVDANVLLNMYRYSDPARDALQSALRAYQKRVFLPHRAAKEFLRNRLGVTAGQATEYDNTIKIISNLKDKLSNKNAHPFLDEDDLKAFVSYSEVLTKALEKKQNLLTEKLTDDEVLEFVATIFHEKIGDPYGETKLTEVSEEGEKRYISKMPPGYKDIAKDDPSNPYGKYGDLIVWQQVIDRAKSKEKPVIFITDDKKEDWWLIQSGKTISPRPELVEEFKEATKKSFWMYSVSNFVEHHSNEGASSKAVSPEVLREIETVSSRKYLEEVSPIVVRQDVLTTSDTFREGMLFIELKRAMRYATGSGKISPAFDSIPKLEAVLIDQPDNEGVIVNVSSGCGTCINFHIHLKARNGLLKEGVYRFTYKLYFDETSESEKIQIPS